MRLLLVGLPALLMLSTCPIRYIPPPVPTPTPIPTPSPTPTPTPPPDPTPTPTPEPTPEPTPTPTPPPCTETWIAWGITEELKEFPSREAACQARIDYQLRQGHLQPHEVPGVRCDESFGIERRGEECPPPPTPTPTPPPPPTCEGLGITIDAACAAGTPGCGINGWTKTPNLWASGEYRLWFDASYYLWIPRNKVHDYDVCYPGPIPEYRPGGEEKSWKQYELAHLCADPDCHVDCGDSFSNGHSLGCGPFDFPSKTRFEVCAYGLCGNIVANAR